ncbi:MAG: CdaR family protein [Candidatus Limnocylindrales bacterium]
MTLSVRRIVARITRNWPLKVGSVVVATFLYAGLVLSQNAQVWPGTIPIVKTNQPISAVLLSNLGNVTNIRYFAPTDVADRLNGSSFTATVDLSTATPLAGTPFSTVQVHVQAADPRVQVLDFDPQVVQVQLDPLISKSVPIKVDEGTPATGLQPQTPVLSTSSATISGPASVVSLATAAIARIVIQPSGLDVDQEVPLVAVDALNNVLSPVGIEPQTVRVQIRVGVQQTRTVPVSPKFSGAPSSGVQVASVTVNPAAVTIEGDADALGAVASIDTGTVDLSGATSDLTRVVNLVLPAGITAVGPSSVSVIVHFTPITASQTFTAGIVLSGARDDRTYSLSVDQVLVTLGGSPAALADIDGQTFSVTVDVDGLAPGVHVLTPTVNLPASLNLIGLSPQTVSVTVTIVPATPPPTAPPSVGP